MQKTSSHIEVVRLDNTIFPSTTIVRPPTYLKVIRCTVIFQCRVDQAGNAYLSTVADQNELNVLKFGNFTRTNTVVPPGVDATTIEGLQTFVFDRLGVGYMVENFYVSCDGSAADSSFIFIWEGIIQST